MFREITECEVCGNAGLTSVMNLGDLPLPDELLPIGSSRTVPKYPTEVLWCDECKTAQMRHRPPNKTVFPLDYHYRAANTKDVLSGMEGLVDSVEKHGLVKGLKVLDIGCNDGSLLDAFARRGAITSGIEPTDAAKEAAGKGHSIEQVYFNIAEAERYVRTYGIPDIVTFVNVFAHIDGLPSLLFALRMICGPQTTVVIENHYLGSVLERNQFDTFYHEHPRTYSYTSFVYIARMLGMHVEWVEFPKRYGGNIRVFLRPGVMESPTGGYPRELLDDEFGFYEGLTDLAARVAVWKKNKRAQVIEEVVAASGIVVSRIPAAAMPGRATILFNILGLDADFISGVYEVPRSKKIGHYVPGTSISILSDNDFPWRTYKGPVLNMAWHIPDEIEARWRERGFMGRFIQAIDPKDFA